MIKANLTVFLISAVLAAYAVNGASAVGDGEGEWRGYFQAPNGDAYFFDTSRVNTSSSLHQVWSRTRYKRSVMGASSYQNLLEINCSASTQRILQRTFFSDKNWEKPAMNTDKREKPKRIIKSGSASEHLFEVLCD